MGLFDFFKPKEPTPPQVFKHNVYEADISQFSSLPRYYYIQGQKYDIDSPDSVDHIPVCSTAFIINDEKWGIDGILREHVNRYFSHIPDILKNACYKKISEYNWSDYKSESPTERIARIHQENKLAEQEAKLKSITKTDMEQFDFSKFVIETPIYDNKMCIMNISEQNQEAVIQELQSLEKYINEAICIADLPDTLHLPCNTLKFDTNTIDIKDSTSVTQYYTFFECCPYTKTGKLSKFPLILHYATKNITEFDPGENYFGNIYYLQDGSIGKAKMVFWLKNMMYKIELGLKGRTLIIKKIEQSINDELQTLYKCI